MNLDDAIEKLEADLAALKRAREVLLGVDSGPVASRPTPAVPSEKPGRDRASITAAYAALVPRAASLDPKTCRAIKLRAEGKMPAAIAAAMKLKVAEVNSMLLAGRRRLEAGRAAPAKPARASTDDDESEPAGASSTPIVEALDLERPGPNELVEEALERIRGEPEPPPAFAKEGAIVVVKVDEKGEALARVLEVAASGLVRVRRIDRYGDPIGKRTWMLVAGELLRPGELPEGVEADEAASA